MRIVFLARQSLPFSPANLEQHRVGGSETSLYYVARGLAQQGHEVVVLNHCGAGSGIYDGVRYFDLTQDKTQWRADVLTRPADVLVLFRRMLDVATSIPACRRVFWALDHQGVYVSDPPSGGRSLAIAWRRATGPLFHTRVDRIFVLSEFMADLFRWLFRTPPDKLVVMPVGIDGALFSGSPPPKHRLRFVHTSVPERGLAQLLKEIFPAVRRVHPAAELLVTSYQPLDAYHRYGGEGVRFLGRVPRHELARILRESSLMLYPANFEEMGAISVLEAMAAGTPAVTSTLGVLPELAGEGSRGVAVPGVPGSGGFARDFVDSTLTLLHDGERLEQMRRAAQEYVTSHHDRQGVVRLWDRTLLDLVEETPNSRGDASKIL